MCSDISCFSKSLVCFNNFDIKDISTKYINMQSARLVRIIFDIILDLIIQPRLLPIGEHVGSTPVQLPFAWQVRLTTSSIR